MNANTAALLLQLVVSLAVIIGLIWLLVKFLALKSTWLNRQRPLKLLGGIGVGPQKSLQIVEVGGVIYVLGVGQDVTLLRVVEDPDECERIKEDFALTRERSGGSWLERFRKTTAPARGENFSSLLSEQLEEVRQRRKRAAQQWIETARSSERKNED